MTLRSAGAGATVRRVGGCLLLVLAAVAGLAWALRRADVRFVLYESMPWPSAPWMAAPFLFFGLALLLSIPPVWRTVLAVLGCFGIAVGVAWLVVAPLIGAGRGEEVDSYPAPQAQYRLVVYRGGFFDPIYYLSIEQQTGLAARSWYLGCLDGDYDWVEKAAWSGPGLIQLETSGEDLPIQVRVNSASGQPLDSDPISADCPYRP